MKRSCVGYCMIYRLRLAGGSTHVKTRPKWRSPNIAAEAPMNFTGQVKLAYLQECSYAEPVHSHKLTKDFKKAPQLSPRGYHPTQALKKTQRTSGTLGN